VKRTLFTKRVIKNFRLNENFAFEELEIEKNESDVLEQVVSSHDDLKTEEEKISQDVEKVDVEKVDVEKIIEGLRKEYEVKLNEAYRRGFQEAEKFLRDELRVELNEHVQLLEQILKNFYEEISGLEQKIEKLILSLALEIAKKIVKREIEKDDDFVVNQVREAVKRVIGVEKIKLRVNPEDEKLIRELKPEILQMIDSSGDVIIEADPGIERGGCIIESDLGNVDVRLGTQFSLIENSLIEMLEQK
jgi:flagellar assembly protein FliH